MIPFLAIIGGSFYGTICAAIKAGGNWGDIQAPEGHTWKPLSEHPSGEHLKDIERKRADAIAKRAPAMVDSPDGIFHPAGGVGVNTAIARDGDPK